MYEYSCTIRKVVDGDTVDVDIDLGFGIWMKKQRIRLFGMDTPESRTRDLEEKKYGLLAKQKMEEWLPVGSRQTLVTVKDKAGKFGRILCKFHLNDQLRPDRDDFETVNEWMIGNHYAVKYFGQSKEEIARQHLVNRERVEIV